jgi:hypothetical protein
MGDMSVESLFPQGRKHFELGSSGWSWILGIDAVGGSPHCDFANEGAGVSPRWCPDWLGVTLAGVVLDLIGEVGDQLGLLCQVGPPARMATEGFWNAREPRQRTWVDRRQLWEAPVEDGASCRLRFGGRDRRPLSAGGGVGAYQFRPPGQAGLPAGSARRVQW